MDDTEELQSLAEITRRITRHLTQNCGYILPAESLGFGKVFIRKLDNIINRTSTQIPDMTKGFLLRLGFCITCVEGLKSFNKGCVSWGICNAVPQCWQKLALSGSAFPQWIQYIIKSFLIILVYMYNKCIMLSIITHIDYNCR